MPVADFGAIFDADLVRVLQVVDEFVSVGVPIFGVPLQRPVKDLLQLRRNRGVGYARRNRVVEQPVIHGGQRRRAGEGQLPVSIS